MVNRDKLQRAGEDNLFVRLLYAKDKPQLAKTRDEQEKLGIVSQSLQVCLHRCGSESLDGDLE